MDDICKVILLWFRDATKQNGHTSMETLYREPLGEMVVHYDNIYKIDKGPRSSNCMSEILLYVFNESHGYVHCR